MSRYFELVKENCKVNKNTNIDLPRRATRGSAGYDISSPIAFSLKPKESILIWTDIKAYMMPDEVLKIYVRSSLGNKGLFLANTVGIIDSTYYGNPSNDGNIGLKIINIGNDILNIKQGERIAQGIFQKYLVVDGDCDDDLPDRIGGYGSTGKQ